MTSNPTIFQKAIAGGGLYDEDIRGAGAGGKSPADVFEALAVARRPERGRRVPAGLRRAASGEDGFVSIEVGPAARPRHAGHDRRGAAALEGVRPPERDGQDSRDAPRAFRRSGSASPRASTSTSRCSSRSRATARSWRRTSRRSRSASKAGQSSTGCARSRASSSRGWTPRCDKKIDAAVTGRQDAQAAAAAGQARDRQRAHRVRGLRAGVRRARGSRALQAKGARLQRLLWASTSTKDPALPGPLLRRGADRAGLGRHDAARDLRGLPRSRRPEGPHPGRPAGGARRFAALAGLGIDTAAIALELEDEGVKKFSDSFDALLKTIAEKERSMRVA